ncbi:hypothetical protein [Streptomyces kurssanovii]|uniref:Uncharacterized protein n=1 Tax=Streptomyces kurssanovii TaxID=67312 RepID=A0ABV3HZC7_9ACTN
MTIPVPKPVPIPRPLADEMEWIFRDLVKSIRADGTVIEDADGNIAVHPGVEHISWLYRSLPANRVSGRRGDH